ASFQKPLVNFGNGCRVASPQSLLGFNLIERRYTSVAHGLLDGFDCCVWCGARFHPLLVGAVHNRGCGAAVHVTAAGFDGTPNVPLRRPYVALGRLARRRSTLDHKISVLLPSFTASYSPRASRL